MSVAVVMYMKTQAGYVRVRQLHESGVLSLESMLVGWNEFVRLHNAGLIVKKGKWFILNIGVKRS